MAGIRDRMAGIKVALVFAIRLYFFRSEQMADFIFIIITVVFFVISWLYVRGCDRL
jgi:hypothetical protein